MDLELAILTVYHETIMCFINRFPVDTCIQAIFATVRIAHFFRSESLTFQGTLFVCHVLFIYTSLLSNVLTSKLSVELIRTDFEHVFVNSCAVLRLELPPDTALERSILNLRRGSTSLGINIR